MRANGVGGRVNSSEHDLRGADWVVLPAILSLLLLIAAPTFSWTLCNDDLYHIARTDQMLNNAGLLSMLAGSQQDDAQRLYGWDRFAVPSDLYRPILDLSFAIDRVLYGFWYPGYRLTNILLHGIATFCVYLVGLSLFGSRVAAALAALLFATVHGNRVAYLHQVAGRTDALAGVFVLLSTALFLAYRARQKRLLLVLALACGALGLFSKEIALGFPFLWLACDLFFVRPMDWRRLRVHAFSFGILVAYLAARVAVLGRLGGSHGDFSISVRRVLSYLVTIPESLVPARMELSELALWAPLLAVFAAIVFPALRQDRRLRMAGLFAALAFYFGAGAAILFRPAGRYVYISVAFVSIWVAASLVSGARIPFARVYRRWAVVSAVVVWVAFLVAFNLSSSFQMLRAGTAAASLTASIKRDLRYELGRMSPGDKLFVVSIPAGCGGQGIFYNGLQEWIGLVSHSTIRPYVLSHVLLSFCPRSSAVAVSSPAEGILEIQLSPADESDELVLSQLDMAQLKVGDQIENRYARYTLREANRVRKSSRSGEAWTVMRFTRFIIQVDRAALESPGRNHFVFHDGECLWVLTDDQWQKIAASGGEKQWL